MPMTRIISTSILISGIVSGCSLLDTYYTYDESSLNNLAKQFSSNDENLKGKSSEDILGPLAEVLRATRIRIRMTHGDNPKLVIHKSYELTDGLKKLIGKRTVNLEPETTTYSGCSYFDARNWSCEEVFSSKYEMRDGSLYMRGVKLKKNFGLAT